MAFLRSLFWGGWDGVRGAGDENSTIIGWHWATEQEQDKESFLYLCVWNIRKPQWSFLLWDTWCSQKKKWNHISPFKVVLYCMRFLWYYPVCCMVEVLEYWLQSIGCLLIHTEVKGCLTEPVLKTQHFVWSICEEVDQDITEGALSFIQPIALSTITWQRYSLTGQNTCWRRVGEPFANDSSMGIVCLNVLFGDLELANRLPPTEKHTHTQH